MDLYHNQKGLSTLTTVLIIGAALILFAGSWIITTRIENDQKVENVLVVSENVLLTHTSRGHARGERTNENGEVTPVFYALLGGEWQEILLEDGVISCEKMDKFGFPSSFISDCILQYPKAKTVAEVIDDISTGNGDAEVDIIGLIGYGSDPSCKSCFNISSGGGDLDVDLGDTGFNPGDTVIINVIINDGDTIVTDVDVIDNDRDDNNDDDDDDGLGDGEYYDITNLPPGVSAEDFYKWLYDIDNSDIEIQIISDF